MRNLFFYRDPNQKEIDLLIQKNGLLFPVELKMTAQPAISMAKHFPALKELSTVQTGTILCQTDKRRWISETVQTLGVEFI